MSLKLEISHDLAGTMQAEIAEGVKAVAAARRGARMKALVMARSVGRVRPQAVTQRSRASDGCTQEKSKVPTATSSNNA